MKVLGIKKTFSKDPIDVQALRKTDRKKPPAKFYRQFAIEHSTIGASEIISIASKKNNAEKGLIIYLPGGAFVSGPAPHHWDAIGKMVAQTQATIWLVDYPKAPEADINQINQNIDQVYAKAAKEIAAAAPLQMIGDSVGATLIMSLVQRLTRKQEALPSALILITPVFDASLTNTEIDEIDKVDPMLSKAGARSAKKMCARELDLKDPTISPLYGDFKGFPETMVLLGGKDIMYPDGKLAVQKMNQAGVKLAVIEELEMPHIFPLLPLMHESKNALSKIMSFINTNSSPTN